MASRLSWKGLSIIGLVIVAGLYGLHRLGPTAEYITLFGSGKKRVDLCRAVPTLSAERQEWVLKRLLTDPLEGVRISAIAACGRGTENPVLDDMLQQILLDPECSEGVKTKAGEVLLARPDVRDPVVNYLSGNLENPSFRRNFPLLVAHFARWRMPSAAKQERIALLMHSFDETDAAHEHLQSLVLNNVQSFKSFREMFIDQLEKAPGFRTRTYIASCLAAIDGAMRGYSAADWKERPIEPGNGNRPHIFEAEWVQDIRPNYQIIEAKGNLCLALDEGAGGYMQWLKGHNGSVDIGSARFSVLAPQDGNYRLWSRVYLDDKCGNSFGIWIDGKRFVNFPDEHNVLDKWHWLPLLQGNASEVYLTAGFHRGRLEAWEDSVYLDKFALLPAGDDPEKISVRASVRWDPSIIPSISFSTQTQSMRRGTSQMVTVWVRRSSPDLTEGTIRLEVPKPFQIVGSDRTEVRFDANNPLCRSSFVVRLPAAAAVGEGLMKAVYIDKTSRVVSGRMILGGRFDWLSTGPLSPDDKLHRKLSQRTEVGDNDLREGWTPLPEEGYDRYRRLDLEKAYGQLRDKYIYLCCEVTVTEKDDYLALLTVDDTANVYIDGSLAISQPEGGPGEGRLVVQTVRLDRGRHRIFAKIYQTGMPDPSGADRDRHSWNHCNFKLLLRKGRHKHSDAVLGLPHLPR